ncbi:MAG: hypothetical protein GY786_10890 [Proteobacteria bacterium]|nr:hypothetical protein [Pseudomonadota bacterium]
MTDEMFVLKCGCATPVGETSVFSAAAVRVQFNGIVQHKEFIDSTWEPMRLGLAPYMNPDFDLELQFNALAEQALEEILAYIDELKVKIKLIPVILGLPEERPGVSEALGKSLTEYLHEPFEKVGTSAEFELLHEGHISTISALSRAKELLKENDFCIVGGVDSYVDKSTLEWLDKEKKRTLSSERVDGFIPGHGAGFCLLGSGESVEKYNLEAEAKILSFATSEEEMDYDSGENSSGKGLIEAVEQTLTVLEENRKVDQIFSSMNGESYHAQEYAGIALKFGSRISDITDFIAPYQAWGDIGAAIVPVLISLMIEAGKDEYGKGPVNLITASSLSKARGSALLELVN